MSAPKTADQHLVARFLQGEKEAFDTLVERYRSKVTRLAMRFTRDPDEAEEIQQEVFLAVYQKLGQFKGNSAFSTWLYRVTVNASLMRLRARPNRELIPLDSFGEEPVLKDEDDQPGVYDHIITEQSLARIENAITPLPDEFKTVIILRDIEGFSNEEAAEIMDLSVAAVKSRLHRARSCLRERLKELYQETVEP